MDELIQRISDTVGLDADTARSTLGTILKFIDGEDQEDTVSSLLRQIPGVEDLLGEQEAESGGGVGGMLGGLMSSIGGNTGGAIAAFAQLKANGVSMDQAQGVASELMGFARENVGDETVDQLLENVPGVGKFLTGLGSEDDGDAADGE